MTDSDDQVLPSWREAGGGKGWSEKEENGWEDPVQDVLEQPASV